MQVVIMIPLSVYNIYQNAVTNCQMLHVMMGTTVINSGLGVLKNSITPKNMIIPEDNIITKKFLCSIE